LGNLVEVGSPEEKIGMSRAICALATSVPVSTGWVTTSGRVTREVGRDVSTFLELECQLTVSIGY
jgi:hypothetical protein